MKRTSFAHFVSILLCAFSVLGLIAPAAPAAYALSGSEMSAVENSLREYYPVYTAAMNTETEETDVPYEFDSLPVSSQMVTAEGLSPIGTVPSSYFESLNESTILIQFVPMITGGNYGNGWSDYFAVKGGIATNVRKLVRFDDDLDAEGTITSGFLKYGKNAGLSEGYLGAPNCNYEITVENARLEYGDITLELDGLNGTFNSGYNAEQDIFSMVNGLSVNAKAVKDATPYFAATVTVVFEDTSVYSPKPSVFATEGGTLPSDIYYSIDGNTVTLDDFVYDGTLTLDAHGNYENIRLIVKNSCSVGALVVNSPVILERWAYGSLTCAEYSEASATSVSFDTNCNGTKKVTANGGAVFQFDADKTNKTQGELDEQNGLFNYEWRHKNTEDYAGYIANIEANRTGTLNLKLVEADGTPIPSENLMVITDEYDYYLGQGTDFFEGIVDAHDIYAGHWQRTQAGYTKRSANAGVAYTSFLWQYYDPSSPDAYVFNYPFGNVNYISDAACAFRNDDFEVMAQPLIYGSFGQLKIGNTDR